MDYCLGFIARVLSLAGNLESSSSYREDNEIMLLKAFPHFKFPLEHSQYAKLEMLIHPQLTLYFTI